MVPGGSMGLQYVPGVCKGCGVGWRNEFILFATPPRTLKNLEPVLDYFK